jgi:hypothetical protein
MANEAKEEPHIKLVETDPTITPGNPFADLAKLRQSQDYEEFLGGEAVTRLLVRPLKEGVLLRINPDPNYSLIGMYTVQTKQGTYFIFPQFRDALGPLPRRCNLYVAVDGHNQYFLLLIRRPNPGSGQEDNPWYTTACDVAAAATKDWIKVTKPVDGGWGRRPVEHTMFKPDWPTKPMGELLNNAFPDDHVVNSLGHDLIKQYEERGA